MPFLIYPFLFVSRSLFLFLIYSFFPPKAPLFLFSLLLHLLLILPPLNSSPDPPFSSTSPSLLQPFVLSSTLFFFSACYSAFCFIFSSFCSFFSSHLPPPRFLALSSPPTPSSCLRLFTSSFPTLLFHFFLHFLLFLFLCICFFFVSTSQQSISFCLSIFFSSSLFGHSCPLIIPTLLPETNLTKKIYLGTP